MRPFLPLLLVVTLGALLARQLWELPRRVASLAEEAAEAEGQASLEDAELFDAAHAAGLIDTADDGRLLLAPADLALAQSSPPRSSGAALSSTPIPRHCPIPSPRSWLRPCCLAR